HDQNLEEEEKVEWISPDLKKVQWWRQLYGRKDSEMNDELHHKRDSVPLPPSELLCSLLFLSTDMGTESR
ncbi:hypothetical protein NE459_25585, partial [[Clostridium] innocuum]|nr:hypothetical protein [[Clostridium] innocuum]